MNSKKCSISSAEFSVSVSKNEHVIIYSKTFHVYLNVTRCIETRHSQKKKIRRPGEGLFSWQTDRTGKEECISGKRDEILETINGITQHKHVTLPKILQIFLKKQKQTSRESVFFLLQGHSELVDPLSYFSLATELKEI
uniref:Uncharacterized protein n=1 Tax=Wuchereria bancrofti TaxID=6293 RepID=A0AAF5Q510_WUCBA